MLAAGSPLNWYRVLTAHHTSIGSRMDHSHWSRSTQILCSDWFRSKCSYASSLRHGSLWHKGRKQGLHVLNVGVGVLHSDWLARTGLEHIAVTQTASNTYSAQLVSGARPRNPHSVISSHRDETGWECDLPGLPGSDHQQKVELAYSDTNLSLPLPLCNTNCKYLPTDCANCLQIYPLLCSGLEGVRPRQLRSKYIVQRCQIISYNTSDWTTETGRNQAAVFAD